jgi:hypothetical protein
MPQTQHKTEKLNLLRPRNLIIAGAVLWGFFYILMHGWLGVKI